MKNLSLVTMLLIAINLNSCKKDISSQVLPKSHQTTLAGIDNGLISYYPFNGNAKDSITGFEGIVHGAVLVPDKHGMKDGAYCFKNCPKYISLPHGIVADSLAVYAIYIRFKADSGTLLHSGDMNTSGSSLEIVNKGIIYKWNFHGYLSSVYTNPNVVNTESWNDLVISVQHEIASIYLNGVDVTHEMFWGPVDIKYFNPNVPHFGISEFLPVGADLIGASYENGKYNKFLDGAVDEVRFYNRFLPLTEITCLYNH